MRCFDISISLKENEEYLEMFLEMCDCSLDDVFLCDNHPNGMCQCNSHRRKTCHGFEEKDRYCPDYMEALVFFYKNTERYTKWISLSAYSTVCPQRLKAFKYFGRYILI